MNPHDSQGNQITDYRGGIYPTVRACGGAGYQQGYLFAPITSYGFDPSTAREMNGIFYHEVAKTLTNGSCPGQHNGVLIVYERE